MSIRREQDTGDAAPHSMHDLNRAEIGSTSPTLQKPSPTTATELTPPVDTDARISQLQNTISRLRETNSRLREQSETLRDRLSTARENLEASRERANLFRDRHKQSVESAKETRQKLLTTIESTRSSLASTSKLWKTASKYTALLQQGILYDMIDASGIDFGADTYLCLLPSTVPTAMTLQRKHGGKVICDCVENVEVERHSLAPSLHPPTLEMINLSAYGALTRCDGMMTVSNAVADTLRSYGPPVRLQPNYRRFEVPVNSHNLRSRIGVSEDTTVLVASGGIVEGFEPVLEALSMLPESVHLAAFARIRPVSYEEHILRRISELGLEHRVHLIGFVPYDELSGLLVDADLGLIVLDPENPNHSVSLPNRVFDFTTATLPFVAPSIPEIDLYVREHQCGTILKDTRAEAWRDAIITMMGDLPRYRNSMTEARSKVTWESLDEGLIEFLGNPQSVTMLGFRDLSRYQRFLRTADSLTAHGVEVKAAFFSTDPAPMKNPNVEFYHYTDRYGREPGLSQVPVAE